jgi:8-hydroxy-5-deazaflavin:NADPH oxidoreductase
MSYAIIGFRQLGQALGKAFVRSGIDVSVATTRDPKSFVGAAAVIGSGIVATTLAQAHSRAPR